MSVSLVQRASRALLERRWITASLALLVLAASLLLGWQWERRVSAEQVRQVSVQARILAGSLAGALAFDDVETAAEHVNALRLNGDVRAAGVYGDDGALVIGFTRDGETLPRAVAAHEPEERDRQVSVVEPVREGTLQLGHVYLRSAIEPLSARLSRYLAIGLVLVLAALLIALLGAANAAAAVANRRLQEQIAAREQAESALRQAQKMEALGQLTGGVAHDFNNLLMAASSGLELMDRAKDDARRAQLKDGIRAALDRGGRITEQLLAFSRRRPLQTEIVRIDEHIGKLAELLDHSLRENIVVRFDIAKDIWPVEVDVSQFDIAILNLAVNAKDAMPRGGTLCLSARNSEGGLDGRDGVEISVEDQGEGMPPEVLDKAFEPFFTTKEIGRGTGLGLSQVYGFVRSAGGAVGIASTPGSGTRVTLLLPRAAAAARNEDPAPADPSVSIDGRTILLVEDDATLNQLIGEMLEEHGGRVVRATSGPEALELFARAPTQLVLSDMVMPGGMDGLELARGLRRLRADVPIVLMTGYSEAVSAASEEGFLVLRKPFAMSRLAACVEQALRRRA